MRIISFVGSKGGIGKTTTSIGLAAALAEKGRRVVLIDLDTFNRTVSNSFAVPGMVTLPQLLSGERPLSEACEVRPGLFVVAGAAALGRVEVPAVADSWRMLPSRLANNDFDYAIMDAPAGWHLMCEMAAECAVNAEWGLCMVPVSSDLASFEGAVATSDEIATMGAASASRVRLVLTNRTNDWVTGGLGKEVESVSRSSGIKWMRAQIPHSGVMTHLVLLSRTPSEDPRAWRLRRAFEELAGEVEKARIPKNQ